MTDQRDHRDSDDDEDLFRRELSDVKPLSTANRIRPIVTTPKPRPRMKEADEAAVMAELEVAVADVDTETGEELYYRSEGIRDSVMRKLRRGKFRVEDVVDLHGLTRAQARELLVEFLREARQRDLRCVRIIHGKGLGSGHRGPVLRRWLDAWLRKREEVMAYCSAPAVDGGSGASYVLLRFR